MQEVILAKVKYFLPARVVANVRIAPDGWKLTLWAPEIAQAIRPGQFVNVYVNGFDPSVLLPRPFSVYDMELERGTIDLVYQAIGPGTRAMARLEPGRKIGIAGPLGNGFQMDPPAGRLVCVAGGIGVTPFMALLRRYPHENVILLFGARAKAYLFALDEFERLGVECRCSTDDGSAGRKGLVTALLEEEIARQVPVGAGLKPAPTDARDGSPLQIAACGPNPMLRVVARIANQAGIPAQLSMENHMPCGLGACRGCAWPVASANEHGYEYRLLCTEGPVLWAKDVLWPKTIPH